MELRVARLPVRVSLRSSVLMASSRLFSTT